jgi:hypothetical protein
MIKKTGFVAALFAIALALVLPVNTLAYYDFVSGELKDSKTGALWAYGAEVEVFNCSSLASINTATLAPGTSTFNIDVSSVSVDTPLCIEVNFAAGPEGEPGNAAKGTYPDRSDDTGTLDTGVYFTGTGPLAVTLNGVSAQSMNAWLPLALVLPLAVLGGVVYTKRKHQ